MVTTTRSLNERPKRRPNGVLLNTTSPPTCAHTRPAPRTRAATENVRTRLNGQLANRRTTAAGSQSTQRYTAEQHAQRERLQGAQSSGDGAVLKPCKHIHRIASRTMQIICRVCKSDRGIHRDMASDREGERMRGKYQEDITNRENVRARETGRAFCTSQARA